MSINDERGKTLLKQRAQLCNHCKMPSSWHSGKSCTTPSFLNDTYYQYRIHIGRHYKNCRVAVSKFFNYACYYRWLITEVDMLSLNKAAGFEISLMPGLSLLDEMKVGGVFVPDEFQRLFTVLYCGTVNPGIVSGKFQKFTVSRMVYCKWKKPGYQCYLSEMPNEIFESIFQYVGCSVEIVANELYVEDADAGFVIIVQPLIQEHVVCKVILNMNTLITGSINSVYIVRKFTSCFKSVRLVGKEWSNHFSESIKIGESFGEYRSKKRGDLINEYWNEIHC